MRSVALFKDEAEEYRDALKSQGFEVSFVETLRYELANQVELRTALERGDHDAVAVTSARAVQAVMEAGGAGGRPVWALEGATAAAVRRALSVEPVGGGGARHAAELAAAIAAAAERGSSGGGGGGGCVLWPHGQRADPTLAAALTARGLTVRALVAYSSHEHAALQSRLAALAGTPPAALAYFSPSGVELVLSSARWLRSLPSFAIGGTTAAALDARGVRPAGVASAPNAAALASTVARYFDSAT